MIEYKLIRSRRKTVAIHITKDASVEVRAPLKTSKADIDKIVASKESWITPRLLQRELNNSQKAVFSLNYGDFVTLCGKTYPIHAKDGKSAGFDGECFYLSAGLMPEEIKYVVIQIYKNAAKAILINKVDKFAGLMGVTPVAVKVNSAKTRWGSCSGTNSINFSWRLVMAEESVIDYVVVHELSHILEHNHSPRFWEVVRSVMPDFRQRQIKLKALQAKLLREDWD